MKRKKREKMQEKAGLSFVLMLGLTSIFAIVEIIMLGMFGVKTIDNNMFYSLYKVTVVFLLVNYFFCVYIEYKKKFLRERIERLFESKVLPIKEKVKSGFNERKIISLLIIAFCINAFHQSVWSVITIILVYYVVSISMEIKYT